MAWKEIWNKKGMDIELPPYLADGYDLLTIEKYEKMVSEVIRPLNLKGTEHILECGCGAGAFLLGVLKTHPKIKVAGIDYSPTLLKRARDQINGDFFEADVTDLKFLDVESYDISHGATIDSANLSFTATPKCEILLESVAIFKL